MLSIRSLTIAHVLLAIAACTSHVTPTPYQAPAPVAPPAPATHPQPVGVAPIVDENNRTFQIEQGPPGDPAVVGCADGQREAFADQAKARCRTAPRTKVARRCGPRARAASCAAGSAYLTVTTSLAL